MGKLVLPNGQQAEPDPEPLELAIDDKGNKVVYDPDTGAVIIFSRTGCVGFRDAYGTFMQTTSDGAIEFSAKQVRFVCDEQPAFYERKKLGAKT